MATLTTRLKTAGALSAAALCAFGTFAGSVSAAGYTSATNSALNWIKTQQQADGSFQGFGAGSTVDATLAIIAAGQDVNSYARGGVTPITFLQSKASDFAKTPGSAGKLLIIEGTYSLPTTLGGVDLVAAVNNSYDPNTGHYGKDVIGHAFAMLGLDAIHKDVPVKAVDFLETTQTPEGGWAFSGDTTAGGADTNTTAVVLQALYAVGAQGNPDNAAMLKSARNYLLGQENADGGFPYQKSDPQNNESDVNSTSYVAQALFMAGDFATYSKAASFIASLQKPNGAFQWKKSVPDDNAGATYQAVPALLGATLATPVAPQNTGATSSSNSMPPTGSPDDATMAALVALGMLLASGGVVVRRKAEAVR